MDPPTIALVIGVSEYLHKTIIPLPAAQVDAVNFARAIRNWGIPEANISLYLNAQAKKQVIDDYFAHLSEKKGAYKLLFYFCGHGYRVSDSSRVANVPARDRRDTKKTRLKASTWDWMSACAIPSASDLGLPGPSMPLPAQTELTSDDVPKSYLLFHDSYVEDNRCFDSLNLDFLVHKISKLSAQEIYVMIDACHLRVNSIMNPKLEEEIAGQHSSSKSLFCLLSSGIHQSFESESGRYGYFTEACLNSLCKIRRSEASPTELLSFIQKEMSSQELPMPEMYNFGNQKISFIPMQGSFAAQKEFIQRQEFVSKIQDALIQQRKKLICLVGETGSGKSAICQNLASEKLKILYAAVPPSSAKAFDALEFLTELVKDKISEDLPPLELLAVFEDRFPFYLITIDQLERLNPRQINELIKIVSRLKTRFLLCTSHSLKNMLDEALRDLFVELNVPPFSYDEARTLIKMIKPDCAEKDCELIHLVSQGNPLKMRKVAFFPQKALLVSSPEMENEFKKAVAAVYSCGLYINEQLFAKIFNVQEKVLHFFEEIGLVSSTENGWVPHDFLLEIAEAENLPISKQSALTYWCQQLEELPGHIQAAAHLILSVKCFGYQHEMERYLKKAFKALYHRGKKPEHVHYLVDAADIFLQLPELTGAGLLLAEILVEWGQFDLGSALLQLPASASELEHAADLCKIQLLWRAGYLQESKEQCTQLMGELKNPSLLIKCYFYRGISAFLEGSWAEAAADFSFVCEHAEEQFYIGRAQCMLGSILGLRGVDMQRGKEYLEAGTSLLMKLKDFSGLWMGLNNLGEMHWKSGEYRLAMLYLDNALQIAESLDDASSKLETLRNLLHLHLRMSGPFSKRTSDLMHEMETFGWQACEYFEQMQLLNTLATAHLFRANDKRALPLLKLAALRTSRNAEYHIYTLSNLALYFKLVGKPAKAEEIYQKATLLAQKGQNLLAIQQLENDMKILARTMGVL